MKVDIAICGMSHYKNFIRYVSEYNYLNKFYCSHKITTNFHTLQIRKNELENIIGKEYLLHLHNNLISNRLLSLKNIYNLIWQLQFTKLNTNPAILLDFAVHGTFLYALKKLKNNYKRVIGHPLTSHPINRAQMLNNERVYRGLKPIKLELAHKFMSNEQNYCDYIHVASHFVKKTYIKSGFPENKIKIIPYGVTLKRFNCMNNKNKNIFRVICVGKLSLVKGQLYLLEAWKKLNLKNAELVLVGKMHSEVKKLFQPYANLFTYYDYIPNEKLSELYNQADLFVLPSLEDGFGLVVLEAMACGLPVVVTENTGAADAVKNGENGFIIQPSSADAIAEKINYFYSNSKKCKIMGENASEACSNSYNWEQYANRLIDFYKTVLK